MVSECVFIPEVALAGWAISVTGRVSVVGCESVFVHEVPATWPAVWHRYEEEVKGPCSCQLSVMRVRLEAAVMDAHHP